VGRVTRNAAEVPMLAARSAVVTHERPEAVRAPRPPTRAVSRTRHGAAAAHIRRETPPASARIARPTWTGSVASTGFDVSARGGTPPALVLLPEARDFEGAVRDAVSLAGDGDTLACMAGVVAEARFAIPRWIETGVRPLLTAHVPAPVARFRARHVAAPSGGEGRRRDDQSRARPKRGRRRTPTALPASAAASHAQPWRLPETTPEKKAPMLQPKASRAP